MFDFLRRLPVANITGVFEKTPGVNIDATFLRNALVNVLFGEKVPRVTYTVGVNGRGSLVVEEDEFRDLLAGMIKMFEVRSPGYVAPALPDVPGILTGAQVAQQTER